MKGVVNKIKVSSCVILSILVASNTKAQNVDFTEIFKAPQEDLTQYLNNYIEPGMLSFANGMAGGWYNTAEAHKPFGFDLTFSINIAAIPESQYLFNFNSADYTALALQSGNSAQVPTLVGGDTPERFELSVGTTFTGQDGNEYEYTETIDFDAPPGIDVSAFPLAGTPAPTLQLGLGLFKNTDLKIRYGKLPEGVIENLSFDVLGFGLMHDIKQWIPGIKHVPIDIALFAGWSRFSSKIKIDEDFPGEFTALGETKLTATNTTFQLLASKKIAILTPYVGLGYNIVSSSVKVTGDFTVYQLAEVQSGAAYTFSDPVDFTYGGGSSFRATVGLRLKLAVLTFHTDYTFQEYNMFTAGLGLSVR